MNAWSEPNDGTAEAPARATPAIDARWIDLGLVDAARLHAAYAGLACAQTRDARPIVLWARAAAHVCLGQGQDRTLEIVPEPGVPVVRRRLGGGAVWIDENQYCFAAIVPRGEREANRSHLMQAVLDPVAATLRAFGLVARRRERDIWVAGRKIAGSGAATIGHCSVIASSFMLTFPAARFARCIALPSAELAAWLPLGLALTVTDWAAQGVLPDPARLECAFRRAMASRLRWRFGDSVPGKDERAAIDAAMDPDDEWVAVGQRSLPGGIRLNATSHLTETPVGHGVRRTLVVDGHVLRSELDGRAHD